MFEKNIFKKNRQRKKQILNHYLIEKDLAKKLKNATKEERKNLYSQLYDELYEKVPYHPQLIDVKHKRIKSKQIRKQMSLLINYLDKDTIFLELGPGDCQLSFNVATMVSHVNAIDVSRKIVNIPKRPENLTIIFSDGSSIDLPSNSIDIAYSNNLIEHLHPEDAIKQTNEIMKVLHEEGKYICITPHRFSGPQDISKYFDKIATGFHIKEYTNKELYQLFTSSGFSKIETYIGENGLFLKLPLKLIMSFETFLDKMPYHLKKFISKLFLFGFRIIIIATK